MSAYDGWNEVCQSAWNSARQTYWYDLDIVRKSGITNSYNKFRSSERIRGDFDLDGRMFRYDSSLSSDTFTVHAAKLPHMTAVILGFRGTDTMDPMRYLNYIPDSYEARLAENFQKATGFNYSDWNSKKNPFTEEMIERAEDCSISVQANAKARETILAETNLSFASANMMPLMTLSSIKDSSQKKNGDKYWQRLAGGRGAPYSDFVADSNIASVLIGSRNLGAIDPKHESAQKFADYILPKFTGNIEFVFTGHSLGASLAFASFLYAKTKYKNKMWFVGFNAATLANFEDVIEEMKSSSPSSFSTDENGNMRLDNAIHYRNEGDLISVGSGTSAGGGFGNWVPTVTYAVPSAARGYLWWFKEADTAANIHGHWTFYKCPRTIKSVSSPYFNPKKKVFGRESVLPKNFSPKT